MREAKKVGDETFDGAKKFFSEICVFRLTKIKF